MCKEIKKQTKDITIQTYNGQYTFINVISLINKLEDTFWSLTQAIRVLKSTLVEHHKSYLSFKFGILSYFICCVRTER